MDAGITGYSFALSYFENYRNNRRSGITGNMVLFSARMMLYLSGHGGIMDIR
jgi:hypothetical protein